MKLIAQDGDTLTFAFRCVSCDDQGELELETWERTPFACPNNCGALYVLWQQLSGTWQLQCVVQPVHHTGFPKEHA